MEFDQIPTHNPNLHYVVKSMWLIGLYPPYVGYPQTVATVIKNVFGHCSIKISLLANEGLKHFPA